MDWAILGCLGVNIALLVVVFHQLRGNSRILSSLGTSLFSSLALRQDALNRETSDREQIKKLAEVALVMARLAGKDQPLSEDQIKARDEHLKFVEERREKREKEAAERGKRRRRIYGMPHGLPPIDEVLNAEQSN
jgi:hypothetical protein